MRAPTHSDALRLFLIASLGLPFFACENSTSTVDGGDGDSGDGDSGDGDSGDGDSGDGDSGDGDGIVPSSNCTNPSPLLAGEDTGFVTCDEGYIHREERAVCPSVLPRDNQVDLPNYGLGGGVEYVDECETDSDCAGPLEYCALTGGGEAFPERQCLSSCVTDADCGAGFVCLCGEEFGTCQPGTVYDDAGGCETDADCSGEEICVGVFYAGACGPGHYQFSCTPFTGESCPSGDPECWEQYECSMQNDRIECYPNVVCGRPFLVDAEDRKAEAVSRDDWCAARARSSAYEATDAERLVAAEYFQKIALMEHASIAAFARFSLQLLSMGAPVEFIEETNQALVDETKHARLAFDLASRFGGRRIGPGSLPMNGAIDDFRVESILRTTILEGCVGETMAALEARAALEVCRDQGVCAVLEQIAVDEERHAALAWKVVSWIVAERPDLLGEAERAFGQAVAKRASSGDQQPGAPALGVLSSEQLRRIHADALDNVVIPCAEGLFRRHLPDRAPLNVVG